MQPSLNTPVGLAILSFRCDGRSFLNGTACFSLPQPMSVSYSCLKDPVSLCRRPHLLSDSPFLLSRRLTPNIDVLFYYHLQSPSPPFSFFKTDLWTFCLWKVYADVDASRSFRPCLTLPRSSRLCLLQCNSSYPLKLPPFSPFHLSLRLSPAPLVFFGPHDVLASVSTPKPHPATPSSFRPQHQHSASAHRPPPSFHFSFLLLLFHLGETREVSAEYDNGYGKPPPSAGRCRAPRPLEAWLPHQHAQSDDANLRFYLHKPHIPCSPITLDLN